jgi:hypothetical protein
MYLSKIDDFLDKIIDDYYSNIFKNATINKLLGETNFVKFQKEINDIFKTYISSLNLTNFKEEFKNVEVQNKIIELLKRYLFTYTFLYIGYFYTNADSTYINNIVEFTKNQPSYNYKIDNFFNSASNAFIIKYYQILRQSINYLNADTPQKKEVLVNRQDYKESISFVTTLGDEFLKLAYHDIKEKNLKAHNIIKTLLLFLIYKSEKKDLFKLLEILNSSEGEFIFIDVVMPSRQVIDFRNIELLLSKKDILKGLAYTLWDYLNEYDQKLIIQDLTTEEKILRLFESGLVLPIVDDFLLYHKDVERYDKHDDKAKDKEDTKIRYIINKLENVININRNNKTQVNKYFYMHMINKRAVTVNNYEDTKIINKFINKGNISTENAELLKELENSTIYPYINFKETDNSFMFAFNKTLDVLRYVNFEDSPDFKVKKNLRNFMRVGSNDMLMNIRGVFIPTNLNALYCIKHGNQVNIKKLVDNDNGYILSLSYIEDGIIKEKPHKTSAYWLFDVNTDKTTVESYEQSNKMTSQDIIKHTLAHLYDEIISLLQTEIIERVSKFKNNINIDNAIKLYQNYLIDKINIAHVKTIKEKLEDTIFDQIVIRKKLEYDIFDDVVNGLTGDIIKIPEYKMPEDDTRLTLRVSTEFIKEKGIYEEKEIIQGVCQHNITWDRLSSLKKIDEKMFVDELYSFIQTYVVENADHEYICKSCGFYLNIKKYIQEGKFDDESKKFIVSGITLDKPLEDIPEYQKFKGSIRSIDKLIEKIALVINISYYVGLSVTVKSRRKAITKDVIDIVIENNRLLKRNYKERNEKASKIYGTTNSNLFAFDLDNSIFIFSSKDKDYLKPIKQNNVIGYMIFLMMLDLNESQISYINADRKGFCNFPIFDKVYQSLFGDLKFLRNNKGDTVPVKNYVIFCYVLYMLACYASKYSIWYFDFKEDAKDKAKKMKLQPIIQKIIIHTVIDIINSILENANTSRLNIYEILSIKFYNKLNSLYLNKDLYNKFKEQYKTITKEEDNTTVNKKRDAIKLTGEYLPKSYEIPHFWRKYIPPKLFLHTSESKQSQYKEYISELTNCETGDFHLWEASKGEYVCKQCNIKISEIKNNKDSNEKITKKYKYKQMETIASKYCFEDGKTHQYILDEKTNKKICNKCKKQDNDKYTHSELEKLDKNMNSINIQNIKNKLINVEDNKKKKTEELNYKEKLLQKLTDNYDKEVSKHKDNIKFIMNLIEILESNISQDMNKLNINLTNNMYILDHDHLGNSLDKPFMINEKDKVTFKEDHPVFKCDVLTYNYYKNGKVDVFYDAISHILLGYKEENKTIVQNKNNKRKIKINYSIFNKLKQLGVSSYHMNLFDTYEEMTRDFISDVPKLKDNEKKDIIKLIIRERHNNISNIIYKFLRLLNRIINGYFNKKDDKDKEQDFEKDYFINKYENLVNKYNNKMNNLETSDRDGKHSVFKHWKGIIDITTINEPDIENINNNINIEQLNKMDTNGVKLIYYFVDELVKLINFNTQKNIKSNLCLFIIDFINEAFESYNIDKYKENIDYKQFHYFIHSVTYIDEIKDTQGVVEGVYEELVDETRELTDEEREALQDLAEEQDAIDIDGDEMDFESMHDAGLDAELNDRVMNRTEPMTYKEYREILSIYE